MPIRVVFNDTFTDVKTVLDMQVKTDRPEVIRPHVMLDAYIQQSRPVLSMFKWGLLADVMTGGVLLRVWSSTCGSHLVHATCMIRFNFREESANDD